MADGAAISLDEFKARLPLVDIVARHVRLTRRGREYVGLCPFHREKTPSFTVSEAKGFFHCFGCGQHGNAIDFVMAIEGLDFGQALIRLAELTGLPAPTRTSNAPTVDQAIYGANQAAARWYAGRLESAQGKEAAAYLAGRGVDRATIERFGLGYAPAERQALKRALLAEGYQEGTLVAAGLLVVPEDGGASYDRFRHRIMFPIHDRQGRVAGFGGRALGEAGAKYLNTPETPAFRKGELLYGLTLARAAARAARTVIVAEGYMDVIALAQAGFAHAVAPLGTAISEAQLTLLWQLADEPIVCLDGDEAGLRAAHRLIERALPVLKAGKSLRFALLPAGQDPDSLLRTAGRDALARRLDEPLPLIEFLWRRELAGHSLSTPERQAAFRQRWRSLAETIADRELRWLFRQAVEQRLRATLGGRDRPRRGAPSPWQAASGGVGTSRLAAALAKPEAVAERDLIGPIVVHPTLLGEVEEEFASLEFAESELDSLQRAILSWYGEGGHLDPNGLNAHLSQVGFASLVQQLSARGPTTAWYCRGDVRADEVLDGWRARVAQQRRFAERRALANAAAAAIVERRDDDARAHVMTVDRLINQDHGMGVPGRYVKGPAR